MRTHGALLPLFHLAVVLAVSDVLYRVFLRSIVRAKLGMEMP